MVQKNIADFKSLIIKLASPEEILNWSHGEVTKPETINYRTLKPEKDGLFCERIFGPTKDWECYCGKYKRVRYRGIVCDKCGVEVTLSKVRRERMGHIKLANPVAHVWFFRGTPSRLSLLLDIPPKSLESVIYFAAYLVTEIDETKRAEAVKSLQDAYKIKQEEINQRVSESKKEIATEFDQQADQTKQKIKNKEALALALHELELSKRQKEKWTEERFDTELKRLQEEMEGLINKAKDLSALSILSEENYYQYRDLNVGDFFKAGMGTESVLDVVKKLDIKKLAVSLREEAEEHTGQRHIRAVKRLRIIEGLIRSNQDPASMILTVLPVIPPDLRPMVQLSGGRFAASDLNDLYRRVINRNNRLKHLIDLGAPDIILRNEKRMLQEAIDALIDSTKGPRERKLKKTVVLRSLSDMLRGKQGRFRQNLLGKRVDYSGRSVIVVGPELELNQCGLPKDMALEMFKPFVLREMIVRGVAPNVRSAKNILEHRPPEVFDILEDVTRDHPVLLNRAPTLHKLGIQAFYPILIEGNAIRLHPCVCVGFNADFDGDQMAVHVPLSEKAKQEAITLMMPSQNTLRPSDGTPINAPTRKEMSLGIYYCTSIDTEISPSTIDKVYSIPEAILAYQSHKIALRQLIKVSSPEYGLLDTTIGRILFNETIPAKLRFVNVSVEQGKLKDIVTVALKSCPIAEVVVMIDQLKNLGFWAGTVSGLSMSIWDCVAYPGKKQVILESDGKVAEIESTYRQGLITVEEEKRLIREVWMETTEELADLTWKQISEDNPIKIIIDAKVGRVSRDTIKQISAMRGLVTDPTGKIVDMPTKSNFREGLSVFEYVTTTRGSRKGLTDTALRTADAGYLTRKLVDVSHEAIIREEDCGTKDGLQIICAGSRGKVFGQRIIGRILAKDILIPDSKKVLFKTGTELDEDKVKQILEAKVTVVDVRSPLTCKADHGLCRKCYGWDFSTLRMVEIGVPVGVIAAQSVGEPGTQLTLRTKHAAGVIGLDVTVGLPRVTELFEVRIPKTVAPLAEISGTVDVLTEDNGYRVKIASDKDKKDYREYLIPLISQLKVEDGQKVIAGTQLASGSLDVREVLGILGLREAQKYLIDEIQAVYESQGIPINDRHFETIIRMMSQSIRIKTSGDTELLTGEVVSKDVFDQANQKETNKGVLTEGEDIILGITRAALATDSWLSAASFQETSNVLADSALMGREDHLLGLKENVIIGRLIPVSPDRAILKK